MSKTNHKHAKDIHSAAEAAVKALYSVLDGVVPFSAEAEAPAKKADLAKLEKALTVADKAVRSTKSAIARLSA